MNIVDGKIEGYIVKFSEDGYSGFFAREAFKNCVKEYTLPYRQDKQELNIFAGWDFNDIPIGEVSTLKEDGIGLYMTGVLNKTEKAKKIIGVESESKNTGISFIILDDEIVNGVKIIKIAKIMTVTIGGLIG